MHSILHTVQVMQHYVTLVEVQSKQSVILIEGLGSKVLKGIRHDDFAVLGQFCAKIITLPIHKMLL